MISWQAVAHVLGWCSVQDSVEALQAAVAAVAQGGTWKLKSGEGNGPARNEPEWESRH